MYEQIFKSDVNFMEGSETILFFGYPENASILFCLFENKNYNSKYVLHLQMFDPLKMCMLYRFVHTFMDMNQILLWFFIQDICIDF